MIYSLLFLNHSISLAIFILKLFHSQAIWRWFHIKFDTLYTMKWMVTLLKYIATNMTKTHNASVHWCVPSIQLHCFTSISCHGLNKVKNLHILSVKNPVDYIYIYKYIIWTQVTYCSLTPPTTLRYWYWLDN